jgi:FimV-like protein
MYPLKITLLMVLFLFTSISHAEQTYGPLRNGETLWTIAPKVKPSDSLTRHQMIIALLRYNPHAFRLSCNINSLKIKQTLTIPSLADIEKISHAEALAAYKEQNEAWKAYRRQGVEISCPTEEETEIEESVAPDENNVVAMTSEAAEPIVITEPDNNAINLPTLSPSPEEVETLVENELQTVESQPVEPEAQQLTENTQKKMSYLPIIIVFAVVLFVFILAFLFRNHGANKPIPEDLT